VHAEDGPIRTMALRKYGPIMLKTRAMKRADRAAQDADAHGLAGRDRGQQGPGCARRKLNGHFEEPLL
jgi:hypothetical protein